MLYRDKRINALTISDALTHRCTELQKARLWLLLRLLSGPAAATELIKEAKSWGIERHTVLRATKGLVLTRRMGYKSGKWIWRLLPPLDTEGVDEFREWVFAKLLEVMS